VLVEIKARFDEANNIAWAHRLEQSGVHVVYGLVGLKTHLKAALVVRKEEDGSLRRYCHVGTGNYNSRTARLYEDLGLLSADPVLCADLTDLFNFLTGYSRRSCYQQIVMAPAELRGRVIQMIQEEAAAGEAGRIVMKLNGLDDPAIVEALYAASAAGTQVDLVVRGICSLRPGVPGLSETIRVKSIVGRFLEHSRILCFGRPEDEGARYLIGSADLRVRNLDRRIEMMVPVEDPELKERLRTILEVNLEDDVNSWVLQPDGRWVRIESTKGIDTHRVLREMAVERARRRRGPSRPRP
ncbi:MAG TPA: RNA degradosome polyphosphate kinase, partial [Acidimicrobiales bacterium]|nr:RNA degradosome polyphosphate kinase [Acidimicrobiales bacterium]